MNPQTTRHSVMHARTGVTGNASACGLSNAKHTTIDNQRVTCTKCKRIVDKQTADANAARAAERNTGIETRNEMDRAIASREHKLWTTLVAHMKKIGAVTDDDCNASVEMTIVMADDPACPPGLRLFHLIRQWGDAHAAVNARKLVRESGGR